MNEILEYIEENAIDGKFISDSFKGKRFEFKIFDCEIIIKYEESMTLDSFKKEANKQYYLYLKRTADFYSSLSDGYRHKFENFVDVLK